MSTLHPKSWLFFALLAFCSCSRHIYIDRSQFVKDGEDFPTVNLNTYKSVQERPDQNPEVAVAFSISGGGSRAANFGIGIMLGLEQITLSAQRNALQEIDYLSTVSGGGFAGGAYIAALFDHQFDKKPTDFSLATCVEDCIQSDLSISYTGFLLRNYFNPKVWFSMRDYGDGLEKGIDDRVLGYKRRKQIENSRSILLGDLFIPKDSTHIPVQFPMHFTNSSVMGTMAIFPFTPDILEFYNIDGYTHRMKVWNGDDFTSYKIPLSVGIKSSGSFPVFVPNSTLHSRYEASRPYLHIMDGAMTDNQGYYTAMEVLKQEKTPKKVLLIVDADASGNLYTFSKRGHSKPPLGVFVSLTASGLYARRAIMKKELIEYGEKFGITPIFLGFNALLERVGVPDTLPARIHIKTEQSRLIELLKKNPTELNPTDAHILYELLVNIGTKYSIKVREQELLFLAGQFIVQLRASEIRAAMQ